MQVTDIHIKKIQLIVKDKFTKEILGYTWLNRGSVAKLLHYKLIIGSANGLFIIEK